MVRERRASDEEAAWLYEHRPYVIEPAASARRRRVLGLVRS